MSYSNASGEVTKREFTLSAEHLRDAMVHDDELPKTHFELQKIPDKLEKIAAEIKNLRKDSGAV